MFEFKSDLKFHQQNHVNYLEKKFCNKVKHQTKQRPKVDFNLSRNRTIFIENSIIFQIFLKIKFPRREAMRCNKTSKENMNDA